MSNFLVTEEMSFWSFRLLWNAKKAKEVEAGICLVEETKRRGRGPANLGESVVGWALPSLGKAFLDTSENVKKKESTVMDFK